MRVFLTVQQWHIFKAIQKNSVASKPSTRAAIAAKLDVPFQSVVSAFLALIKKGVLTEVSPKDGVIVPSLYERSKALEVPDMSAREFEVFEWMCARGHTTPTSSIELSKHFKTDRGGALWHLHSLCKLGYAQVSSGQRTCLFWPVPERAKLLTTPAVFIVVRSGPAPAWASDESPHSGTFNLAIPKRSKAKLKFIAQNMGATTVAAVEALIKNHVIAPKAARPGLAKAKPRDKAS